MAENKRSANFTSKEESILLSLVKKYKEILENKKNDSNNNKNKLEGWKTIETEFNCESVHKFRDSMTLRKKYDNLKKRTKKKLSDEKCYAIGTGGGPPQKPPEITDIDMEIKEILAERIDGFQSEFGGDAEIMTIINVPDKQIDESCVDDLQERRNDLPNIDKRRFTRNKHETDWSKNTVENLKTPISKILTVGDGPTNKRKRNEYDAMCSKVTQWAASKANLESEKIRFAEEEQKKKIDIMERRWNTECELMRKESEAKIKKLEQETEVTIAGIIECNKLKKDILLLEKHVLLQKLKRTATLDN